MPVLQNWLLFGSYFQLYSIIKVLLLLKASFGAGVPSLVAEVFFLLALQFFTSLPQITIKFFTCEIVVYFLINRDFFSLEQRGNGDLNTLLDL